MRKLTIKSDRGQTVVTAQAAIRGLRSRAVLVHIGYVEPGTVGDWKSAFLSQRQAERLRDWLSGWLEARKAEAAAPQFHEGPPVR